MPKTCQDKSKKITTIPDLINSFNIKNCIITADAMATQRNIVSLIREKGGQYVLALKANHKHFHEAVQALFSNPQFLTKCAYHKTEEKARGGLEIREYWQSTNIKSLVQRGEWKGLRSIAMVQRTTIKNGATTIEKGSVPIYDTFI